MQHSNNFTYRGTEPLKFCSIGTISVNTNSQQTSYLNYILQWTSDIYQNVIRLLYPKYI